MKDFFEEFVNINGVKQYFIHYFRKSDTTVIFLHGGPAQSEAHFLYKTENENNNYNLVYYDQRGTGKTYIKNKSSGNEITIEILIDDLKETINYIRNKYKSKYIILLGHSWGSVLGIEFIKKYSNEVSAYIGIGQVVDIKKGERIAYEHCLNIVRQSENKKYINKMNALKDYPYCINKDNAYKLLGIFRNIQIKYRLAGYNKGVLKLLNIIFKSPIFSINDLFAPILSLKANKNLLNYLIDYSTYNFLNFDIPIFFICGMNDWQVPSVLAKEYIDKINATDKDCFFIQNAGHLLNIENTKDYLAALNIISDRIKY